MEKEDQETEKLLREALTGVLSECDVTVDEGMKKLGDDDFFSEVLGKTQHKIDELNIKAEEIYRRMGMNREQLEVFIANPNNFSPEQWANLEKIKKACARYKQDVKAKIESNIPESIPVAKRDRKKDTKRFGKKKHWISS